MLFAGSPQPKLVGIAKLASESELLEAKSRVRYFELPARGLLNRTKPGMPFAWTVNPYRGCELGCKYCYARYTHEFMGMEDGRAFEDRIYAKADVARILRRELRGADPREAIAIGTATDPYQPAERRFGRTRSILEIFAAERGRRLSITTKSDLIVRDLDLLREVARANVLSVNITVTTLDAGLARLLEPRAPRPALRLAAVRALREGGILTGVFPNPVMPFLTDGEASLDELAAACAAAGAQYFGGAPLFLMPSARKVFLPFIEEHFPELLGWYREHFYRSPRLSEGYKETLRRRIQAIRERHGLGAAPMDYRPELEAPRQLELFPELH